jgi:hypothetical protein
MRCAILGGGSSPQSNVAPLPRSLPSCVSASTFNNKLVGKLSWLPFRACIPVRSAKGTMIENLHTKNFV